MKSKRFFGRCSKTISTRIGIHWCNGVRDVHNKSISSSGVLTPIGLLSLQGTKLILDSLL